MHGAQNQDSHAMICVNSQCVQLLCLPALEGDDGMHYGCFDNGVCMYGAYRDLLELVCEAIL